METPRYLGPIHHPALGVRIPEVLLEGVFRALSRTATAAGIMLSYHRETAPEYVINAPPGVYEVTRGHTGTSIRSYILSAVEKARKNGVVIEAEADHLAAITTSVRAVMRISGAGALQAPSASLEEALRYVEDEVREAADTRFINFFTLDACDYIDYRADKLDSREVESFFEQVYDDHAEIVKRYTSHPFRFITEDGGVVELRLRREDVARIAVKLHKPLEVIKRMYDIVKSYVTWPVGFEIAFDETPYLTRAEELLFLLQELRLRGIQPDFVAPNVGFEKRADYAGDIKELESRVSVLASIARAFGSLLSFHSGSGSSPWSGKGPGVYKALLRATGRKLKYKVSGVYMELVFHVLSRQPQGSPARRLYEEIYQAVVDYLEEQVEARGELYSETLEKQLKSYFARIQAGEKYPVDAEVFRHYSFLAFNLREGGRRIYRERLVELYQEDEQLKRAIDREVAELTSRLIDGLEFAGNISLLR
ncbi:MAG: tagaturonate epimerase family protein [Thermofilum sp.]